MDYFIKAHNGRRPRCRICRIVLLISCITLLAVLSVTIFLRSTPMPLTGNQEPPYVEKRIDPENWNRHIGDMAKIIHPELSAATTSDVEIATTTVPRTSLPKRTEIK